MSYYCFRYERHEDNSWEELPIKEFRTRREAERFGMKYASMPDRDITFEVHHS